MATVPSTERLLSPSVQEDLAQEKSAYHSDKRNFCLLLKCMSAALLDHKTAKSSESLENPAV